MDLGLAMLESIMEHPLVMLVTNVVKELVGVDAAVSQATASQAQHTQTPAEAAGDKPRVRHTSLLASSCISVLVDLPLLSVIQYGNISDESPLETLCKMSSHESG